MEKENIKFGVESIFHMIRHFEKIHTDDLVKLITSGYNQQQIDEELNIYYQYFFPSINIKDNNDVGAVSVLPIELLSLEQKENIYIQENRGYKLKHIKVDQLPKTKEWTMILKPQTNNISYFITAFPGLPAMPIPRNDMNKNQKEECIDFWNKHVFLVISNNSASS